ncbi:MAG: hypothetical protein E5V90_08675 [Mesorhizobium sp.]|nr:MAG: hypothetical protein E5V90_08675 [Mesorhizobium sp.]
MACSGEKIELTGEVVRVDDDTVSVGGKDLGITLKRSSVRLVTSHMAPKRALLDCRPTTKPLKRNRIGGEAMNSEYLKVFYRATFFVFVLIYPALSILVAAKLPLVGGLPITRHLTLTAWIVAMLVLGVGLVLFWIREHFRLVYGLAEIAISIIALVTPSGTKAFVQIVSTGTSCLLFLGGVCTFDKLFDRIEEPSITLLGFAYLLVRGLDNTFQGMSQFPALKPLASWIMLRPTNKSDDR